MSSEDELTRLKALLADRDAEISHLKTLLNHQNTTGVGQLSISPQSSESCLVSNFNHIELFQQFQSEFNNWTVIIAIFLEETPVKMAFRGIIFWAKKLLYYYQLWKDSDVLKKNKKSHSVMEYTSSSHLS